MTDFLNNLARNTTQWITQFHQSRNIVAAYLIALALSTIALIVRLTMAPPDAGLQYVTFFPAVALAAVIGGFGPSLFAAIICALFSTYFFTEPYFSITIGSINLSFWSNIIFIIGCLIVCTSIEAMHRYRTSYLKELEDVKKQNDQIRGLQKESDERFRGTLEQAAVGIAHASLDGQLQRVNQKFCDILGYDREELSHMRFHDISHPADMEENIRNINRMLSGEITTFAMEKRYIRKDRQIVWTNLTVSLLRDTNGTPKFTIGVIEDISRRKYSEAQAQRFGNLLQNAFDEIYLFDAASLHFLQISEGARANLGYTSEEMRQLTPTDISPTFTMERFKSMSDPLREGAQHSLLFESTHLRKNGTIYPVEVRLQYMHSDTPVFMAVVHDLTERKNAERQLHNLSAHIQTVREEEKAGFAREIHDNLGGTLTALKMDTYWLAEELPASQEFMPLREHIQSMSLLLDNAVEVTRRVITDLRPTILDDLGLQAAIEWQAGQFQKRTNIQCRVMCIETSPCELDKTQMINLFRIFQESLTNISRHSGASRVDVELQCKTDEVIFVVSDNGCGLPIGHTISPTSYGLLGMRERVEQMNGIIDFCSIPDSGFSVTVILPIAIEKQKGLTS